MISREEDTGSPESLGPPPAEDLDGLVDEVYGELRRLAAHYFRAQSSGHTLQPTALVHEVYLRLSSATPRWRDRNHFLCIAAKAMRQVLVNHARDRQRLKRGGGRQRLPFEEGIVVSGDRATDLEALDDALQHLAARDPRMSQIVELRYFGGLSVEETADVLGISPATVKRDWSLAKAWLLDAISGEGDRGG